MLQHAPRSFTTDMVIPVAVFATDVAKIPNSKSSYLKVIPGLASSLTFFRVCANTSMFFLLMLYLPMPFINIALKLLLCDQTQPSLSFKDFPKVIPILYFLSCSDTLQSFAVLNYHLTAFVAVASVGTCIFHIQTIFLRFQNRRDFQIASIRPCITDLNLFDYFLKRDLQGQWSWHTL